MASRTEIKSAVQDSIAVQNSILDDQSKQDGYARIKSISNIEKAARGEVIISSKISEIPKRKCIIHIPPFCSKARIYCEKLRRDLEKQETSGYSEEELLYVLSHEEYSKRIFDKKFTRENLTDVINRFKKTAASSTSIPKSAPWRQEAITKKQLRNLLTPKHHFLEQQYKTTEIKPQLKAEPSSALVVKPSSPSLVTQTSNPELPIKQQAQKIVPKINYPKISFAKSVIAQLINPFNSIDLNSRVIGIFTKPFASQPKNSLILTIASAALKSSQTKQQDTVKRIAEVAREEAKPKITENENLALVVRPKPQFTATTQSSPSPVIKPEIKKSVPVATRQPEAHITNTGKKLFSIFNTLSNFAGLFTKFLAEQKKNSTPLALAYATAAAVPSQTQPEEPIVEIMSDGVKRLQGTYAKVTYAFYQDFCTRSQPLLSNGTNSESFRSKFIPRLTSEAHIEKELNQKYNTFARLKEDNLMRVLGEMLINFRRLAFGLSDKQTLLERLVKNFNLLATRFGYKGENDERLITNRERVSATLDYTKTEQRICDLAELIKDLNQNSEFAMLSGIVQDTLQDIRSDILDLAHMVNSDDIGLMEKVKVSEVEETPIGLGDVFTDTTQKASADPIAEETIETPIDLDDENQNTITETPISLD